MFTKTLNTLNCSKNRQPVHWGSSKKGLYFEEALPKVDRYVKYERVSRTTFKKTKKKYNIYQGPVRQGEREVEKNALVSWQPDIP